MEDETTQTADDHIKFLIYILLIFKKSFDNFTARIGDNCVTNQSITTKLKNLLIGCASHCFPLTVPEIITSEEDAAQKI